MTDGDGHDHEHEHEHVHGEHDHEEHEHDEHEHEEHGHGEHEHVHRPATEADYVAAVEAYRSDKDHFFRHAPGSPIPIAERDDFGGLPYFAVDPALSLEGLRLEPYTGNEPESFQIPTSDGKLRDARRAGTLAFEIDGTPLRLTGYTFANEHSHSLFVPFLDGTSGRETYGGGRYLDLEPEDDGSYWLDFNLAYHPSCVYDPKYSCPLTPPENRLPVRIAAGERLPEEPAT